MVIQLNEKQSRILLEIAVKDLYPKELEKLRKAKEGEQGDSNTN